MCCGLCVTKNVNLVSRKCDNPTAEGWNLKKQLGISLTGSKIPMLDKLVVCVDKLELMGCSWMMILMCSTLAAAGCSCSGIPVSWLLSSGKCHFS